MRLSLLLLASIAALGLAEEPEVVTPADEVDRQTLIQQQLIAHVLTHVPTDCASELRAALSTPPEEQSKDQISDSCRAEIDTSVAEFYRQFEEQVGGEDGEEGMPKFQPPSRPTAQGLDSIGVAVQLLLLILTPIGLFLSFVFYKEKEKSDHFNALPEAEKQRILAAKEEARIKEEKRKAKKRRQGKSTGEEEQ